MLKIEFKGEKYLFDGEDLNEEGFIATEYQYEHFIESFAYYRPDEGVNRHGRIIGSKDDIKIIGKAS